MASANGNGHKRETVTTLREDRRQLTDTVELFSERLAELELSLEDQQWRRIAGDTDREFSQNGMRTIVQMCRLSYLKNPLINRAVELQKFYVFAQGMSVSARHPKVNEIVQEFMDDRANRAELTSHQARCIKEVELAIAGNLFFTMFTDAASGRVRLRSIPVEEVITGEIVTNPEDSRDPWYYKRVWNERSLDVATGTMDITERIAYYPDWQYRPAVRPSTIGGQPVLWDAPVLHVKVGGLDGMRMGVPEIYSAIDWARAVKQDLEDYATVRRALARFAWNITTKGGSKAIAAAKARLNTTFGPGGVETNPAPATGSTFIGSDPDQLKPVHTAGAQPSPDEGRRLWLMVCAAVGLPESMLDGDIKSGGRATAQTLDRPTELKMRDRQTLWADVHRAIFSYVIEQAVRAQDPRIAGEITQDPRTGEDTVVVELEQVDGKDVDQTIDVNFPDLLEHDPVARVTAITTAATLNGNVDANVLPPEVLLRLCLSALGVEDLDEIIDARFPGGANAIEPYEPPPPPPDPLALAAARASAAPAPGQSSDALKVAREAIAAIGRPNGNGGGEAAALREALADARRREPSALQTIALLEKAAAGRDTAFLEGLGAIGKGMGEIGRGIAARPTQINASLSVPDGAIQTRNAIDATLVVPQGAISVEHHIDKGAMQVSVAPADVRVEHHDRGPTEITRRVTKADRTTGEPLESTEKRSY